MPAADYRDLLGQNRTVILPYFGGPAVHARNRIYRLAEPVEVGWWSFAVRGQSVTAEGPAEPADMDDLSRVSGHLFGDRLVVGGAVAEPVYFLPEDEPPQLSPCSGRRWYSGEVVFEALQWETEAEEAARRALEEEQPLSGVKGVPATLRAAYGYALAQRVARALGVPVAPAEIRGRVATIAEQGRDAAVAELRRLEAERVAFRRQAVLRQATIAAAAAVHASREQTARALDRAEAALSAAGATLLASRRLREDQIEVTWRFMGERFMSIAHAATLQVIDSGICLDGTDDELTLESLPAACREAIATGSLVITRRDYDYD